MTDLVVKTCGGDYLVDMDSTIMEKLRMRYADYEKVEINPNYWGEKRIRLKPGSGDYLNHIEVDVPPGCYVVWTRVCYCGNEETNKVMVIVDCGGEACVNLLLDRAETCIKEALYPAAVLAIGMRLPENEVGIAVKALMQVAEIPKEVFVAELEQKFGELQETKGREAQEYLKATDKLLEIVKSLRTKEE
jgi:hypothetical protein